MAFALNGLLRERTCLYASFDQSADADVSRGDSHAKLNGDVVRHESTGGRFGGALVFSAKDHGWAEDECVFAARDNFPYKRSAFEGTVSLWLQGDPDADLSPLVPVDPFHISRHAADASYYLDLTKPNDWRYGSPRKLRFGYYNDSPERNMFVGGHLIVVGELGWNDRRWHHVVATWKNANSGNEDGSAAVYLDGRLRGSMAGYKHQLTWDVDKLKIGLGQRYAGKIDELLILDVALSAEQAAALYSANQPAGVLMQS